MAGYQAGGGEASGERATQLLPFCLPLLQTAGRNSSQTIPGLLPPYPPFQSLLCLPTMKTPNLFCCLPLFSYCPCHQGLPAPPRKEDRNEALYAKEEVKMGRQAMGEKTAGLAWLGQGSCSPRQAGMRQAWGGRMEGLAGSLPFLPYKDFGTGY